MCPLDPNAKLPTFDCPYCKRETVCEHGAILTNRKGVTTHEVIICLECNRGFWIPIGDGVGCPQKGGR